MWRHAKMRPCPADGSASRRRWRAGLALLLLPFFLAACESDDGPYRLTLELSAGGEVLQTLERDFSSNVSQAALPEKPLTVGPGYARNPESR